MERKDFLFAVSMAFGVGAFIIWLLRLYNYEINIVYPLSCNAIQFIAMYMSVKENKTS